MITSLSGVPTFLLEPDHHFFLLTPLHAGRFPGFTHDKEVILQQNGRQT